MYSRSHLLIEREFENFRSLQPWGIEAHPLNNDNIFEWVAKIKGLKDTLWEAGIFRVYLKFDENFNIRPPQVCFHTVPFHPNIDMITGRPCIDFLDDYEKWQENYSVSMILLSVQSLLSNPSYNNAVNMDAVEIMKHSPYSYKQMVEECVTASQRLEAGIPIQPASKTKKIVEPSFDTGRKLTTMPSKITKLSFDDYHMTWCGIATSKPKDESKNSLLEALRDKPVLQRVHMGIPSEEIQKQVKKQMQEHSSLMYGRFGMRPTPEEEKADKLNRLERMKKIYLPPRVSPTPAPDIVLDSTNLPVLNNRDDPWEKEVDDLVAWTANLDAAAIDT